MSLSPPPSSPASARPLVALSVALVGGTLAGALALGQVSPALPTELERLGVLRRALASAAPHPQTVILGDSVAMSGVDTARLSAALGRTRPAWNLATPGQTPLESAMLLDTLPPEVAEVIYAGTVDSLVSPTLSIARPKLLALRLYDYRIGEATRAVADLDPDRETLAVLAWPRWRVILGSRWMVRATIDLQARRWFRPDLEMERAVFDLFHPVPYTRPVPPAARERLFRSHLESRRLSPPRLASTRTILARLQEAASAHGRAFTAVVLPEHPDLRAATGPELYATAGRLVEALRGAGVTVWEFDRLLAADEFADDAHPLPAAARHLTDALARRLAAPTDPLPAGGRRPGERARP